VHLILYQKKVHQNTNKTNNRATFTGSRSTRDLYLNLPILTRATFTFSDHVIQSITAEIFVLMLLICQIQILLYNLLY